MIIRHRKLIKGLLQAVAETNRSLAHHFEYGDVIWHEQEAQYKRNLKLIEKTEKLLNKENKK